MKPQINQDKLPAAPFEVIAISLSGGGYRAAAFHLGSLTYLEQTLFKGRPLLKNVQVLSTVSGGTFTGVRYAVSLQQNKDMKTCYKELCDFMRTVDLTTESLTLLNSKTHFGYKAKNLINAFALVYYEKFEKNLFSVLWSDSHLKEISFNASEFSNGAYFRFQKTKNDYGFMGNYHTKLDVTAIQQVRLADIIAASSCFPAGFEPLSFPADFKHETAGMFNCYADGLLLNSPDLYPMFLMDGGICDNQGIDSVILAEERMHTEEEFKWKTHPIDLYIISDVSDRGIKPLKIEYKQKERMVAQLTLKRFQLIGIIALLISAGLIGLLVAAQSKLILIITTFLFSITTITTIICLFLGNLFTQIVPQWINVPEFFIKPLKQFNKIKFGVYHKFIKSRFASVMKMVTEVFMNQIKRLSFKRIYNDPEWSGRAITTAIYELEEKHKKDLLAASSSDRIKEVTQKAAEMKTSLWFEKDDLIGNENRLAALIACGQYTLCYNLLNYILQLKKIKGYPDYPQETRTAIDEMESNLQKDWQQFNADPFWLQREYEK